VNNALDHNCLLVEYILLSSKAEKLTKRLQTSCIPETKVTSQLPVIYHNTKGANAHKADTFSMLASMMITLLAKLYLAEIMFHLYILAVVSK
jgi:hypothetical protein